MRALAILHAYPPAQNAGGEWMVHTMLRALVARGNDVDVLLTTGMTRPYVIDGVQVSTMKDKSDPHRLLATADVVISHLENTMRATALGQCNGVPVIHVCHNTHAQTGWWLTRRPDLAVFNSQWMADYFSDHDGWSIIVRPPVLGDEYRTSPGDHVTLINLYAPKGAATFYALAERMPKVKFLAVVGGYGDQEIRRDLPNVEILEHVPGADMAERVYSRTKVLLMPSVYESWGRVAIEAAASGIPTLASPTPGLRESLADAGTFAELDDLDAWETSLRKLLTPRGWSAASKKAVARAKELDPAPDLALWCDAVESLARRRVRSVLAS